MEEGRSPNFWFKEAPEGIRVMTREELTAAQSLPTYRMEDLTVPGGNFRVRLIDIIDEKYPLGTVVARGIKGVNCASQNLLVLVVFGIRYLQNNIFVF